MVDLEEIEAEELRREEKSDSISNYLEKKKRIKKEVARLKRLFKEIDDNKKKLVFTTIDDVAFMTITMQDLRDDIIRDGTTVEYKNGENQSRHRKMILMNLWMGVMKYETIFVRI